VENTVGNAAEHRLKEPLLESSVVEWLDKHPATSPEGRCAWCGRAETADAAVLPYGKPSREPTSSFTPSAGSRGGGSAAPKQ
jgi:hypothetical protein